VVGRYKDDVRAWDVVNEAVKDAMVPELVETIWREDSPWYQAYGDATYIQDASTSRARRPGRRPLLQRLQYLRTPANASASSR
jgi:GH35 family endo-1,4-beta-xylanase